MVQAVDATLYMLADSAAGLKMAYSKTGSGTVNRDET